MSWWRSRLGWRMKNSSKRIPRVCQKIAKAHLSRFKHFVSTFFHSLVYHCRGYSLWVGSLSNMTWKQKLFSILNVFKFFKFSGFQVFKILSFSSFSKHSWFPAFVWHSEIFFKDLGTMVHRWPFVIWIYLCCCFILVHLIHDLQKMQCLIHKSIQLPGFFKKFLHHPPLPPLSFIIITELLLSSWDLCLWHVGRFHGSGRPLQIAALSSNCSMFILLLFTVGAERQLRFIRWFIMY